MFERTTSQSIGINPSEDFVAPSMALDAYPALAVWSTVESNLPYPSQWCGQSQPHGPHTWVRPDSMYASCGGHS